MAEISSAAAPIGAEDILTDEGKIRADGVTDNDEEIIADEATPKDEINYEELAKADLLALQEEFPELRGKTSITELSDPLRFAALRDLGLTAREAYLATEPRVRRYDNRSHLKSSVPSGAMDSADHLSGGSLEAARELFSGLSDREIQILYKKVTK